MPRKGQQISEEHRYKLELGEKRRELGRLARLSTHTEKQKQRMITLGDEIRKLMQDYNRKKHFTECYIVMYPTDPDVYCTCLDYSPEQ